MTAPTAPEETLALRCSGRVVGRYVHRPALAPRLSPRPYLHPVRTLGGVAVTELMPADHLHHLGAGLAVPDVDGRNFWGGRTFVAGRGPTELDNHGEQRHTRFVERDDDGFVAELAWSAGGRELLRERRTVTAAPLGPAAWALSFAFTLTNTSGADLSLGSPATNGRAGAGYGGFFWRAPKEAEPPAVRTGDGEGTEAVHGRRADWLALAGRDFTLVFAGATDATRGDPWFVRTREYPGVGSALAWSGRLPLPPGADLTRQVVTAVVDGSAAMRSAAELAQLAHAAVAAAPAGGHRSADPSGDPHD
ncbi:PmoA family protein [Streptomyces synnematoformans]|uniref:PmoA family protein n=1 Tax=Streptomyces synnematoformans TaxID=415721 RepID=A0ABP5J9A2_9ACTN